MLRRIVRVLDGLLRRPRLERDMDDEIRFHLLMETEERGRRGLPPGEAWRSARRDFGSVERWKEEGRAARGLGGWDALRQDLRYAARTLLGSPGFAAVAVLTLAVGIGATTALFSVVDGLLLRPLGYPEPDRVVRLLEFREDGTGRGTISAPNFYDWMERSSSFEAGALYDEYAPILTVDGEPRKVPAASVGARYFDVLGVQPAVGRFFLPEEDEPGSARVVLSWGLWREVFGGDPEVPGTVVDLSGFPYTVVGVARDFEDPGLSGGGSEPPRLWRSTPTYFGTNGRGGRSFTAVARLAPGATLERAREELARIHGGLTEEYPEQNRGQVVRVVSLEDDLVGAVRPLLLVLLGAVGLVLLIACANVANLLLFRAAGRGREVSLRAALGASRARVVRQLMVESSILALAGALGGLGIALVAVRGVVALAAGQLPRLGEVGLDLRVLGFALALAGASALIFGLLPALDTSRVDLRSALAEGSRNATGGRRQGRLRSAVVAVEVALAVVVMLGAGLLGRSLLRLQAVDPGLRPAGALVLRIDPPPDPYDPSGEAGAAPLLTLYDRLHERLGALPGVESVGMTDLLPMSGSFNGNAFRIEGRPEPVPEDVPRAESRAVSPSYFRAMGIPLLRGRAFLPSDGPDAGRVVVVNQSLQRRYFPGEEAVGHRLRIFGQDASPAAIVGVVGDVTQFSLDEPPDPVVYVPTAQAPAWMQDEPWIVLRAEGDAGDLAATARAAVREVDPRIPVYGVSSMEGIIEATLARPRFRTFLLLGFAGIAFLLAGVGVYGMVAYTAARRLPELGVRMALGADARRILGLMVGQGLRPVLAGAAVGLAVGFAAVRVLTGFLFGVPAMDPVTFTAVPLALTLVAALAAWLPARRAARLPPARVLRAD